MRAIVVHETGGPEVLREEDLERPEPGEGEVMVRVHAASVNPIDWKFRSGRAQHQLPAVLGSDISGTVEESRVESCPQGTEVFGFARTGAYAEFAATPAALLAPKPRALSHAEAAALPVAALTAWQALFDHGELKAGQTVLVAGAAGGVGHLAVQLAGTAGARVIGIGSTNNRDFVLGLGADEYVDYSKQDVATAAGGAVDVAFDTVGGATTAQLVPTLREGGVLVTIANAAPEQEAAERGARATVFSMSPKQDQLVRVAEMVAEGKVRVQIAAEMPLGEVPRAHELSEQGHTRGKIVLLVA
jgi:NADPH:quinone reductase-like Zn-dependent oxidoreductase